MRRVSTTGTQSQVCRGLLERQQCLVSGEYHVQLTMIRLYAMCFSHVPASLHVMNFFVGILAPLQRDDSIAPAPSLPIISFFNVATPD